jgi:hypothetical protein
MIPVVWGMYVSGYKCKQAAVQDQLPHVMMCCSGYLMYLNHRCDVTVFINAKLCRRILHHPQELHTLNPKSNNLFPQGGDQVTEAACDRQRQRPAAAA